MKKVYFSDKYGLTQAVLDKIKTNTRRSISNKLWKKWDEVKTPDSTEEDLTRFLLDNSPYKLGEVVSVAQAYRDFGAYCIDSRAMTDKRYVKAEYMPHQIRITNVRVERLQDITDEDCIAEGVEKVAECENLYRVVVHHKSGKYSYLSGKTPREAYAALIDRISDKGTWDSNPYVFVYEFELVK